MSVRDLGYRAYEGELLPPSHNMWVMLRYGLWRIWGSWINKFVVFFFWLPVAALAGIAFLRFLTIGPEMPADATDMDGVGGWFLSEPAVWLRTLTGIQFWFCMALVTIRSGAAVIAEDFTNKAYQFYFAKPVTPVQYLVGRISALAVFNFGLVFIPVAFMVGVLAGVGPEEQRLERVGLLLPALVDSAMLATVLSVVSISVSALSRSRALTITAWVVVLFVPFVLAGLVETISESEWVYVISLPGALWNLGDALYKVEGTWTELKWFFSLPAVLIATVGGAYGAWYRIRKAEVIT
ncbi:MAG: hypothetical protein AB8I08_17765 [Sandaracinaceae bacterium]